MFPQELKTPRAFSLGPYGRAMPFLADDVTLLK